MLDSLFRKAWGKLLWYEDKLHTTQKSRLRNMVRKSRKGREEWKIMHNVFDQFTDQRIQKLITEGQIDGLYSPISIGKEANIFSAKKGEEFVIVKIYRLESCNFNKMYDYIKADERYEKLKKQRREIIFAWTQREYRNLMLARDFGVRVPMPTTIKDHILVMEMIGEGSTPSPQLKDATPDNPQQFFEKVAEMMKKLVKNGLVHGDLSKFNILNHEETPVFIDFSQATTKRSDQFQELVDRDIKNVTDYFSRIGLKKDEMIKQLKTFK